MLFLCLTLAAALMLAACAPNELPDPPPDLPVTSVPASAAAPQEPAEMPYAPKPGDVRLLRGEVFISEAGLVVRESFPPQIALMISGELPTPCHELRVAISQPDVQNRIEVEAYSVVDSELICTQVLKPFQESIELGTFPGGHYTVWLNGDSVGEFDS